jgi:ABC-type polysaccharide/polyol phosphate export permease
MADFLPASQATLSRSLAVQLRVVKALMLREALTRYGRHNIGFLWLFIEPMIFTVGVAALWAATRIVHQSQLPIVSFAVTGYSAVLLWRNMPNRCVDSVMPNMALMYHRNVKVMDIFVSRIALEAAGATTSFIVLATFFTALGWMDFPENVPKVFAGWLLLAWFGAALSILLGAWSEQSKAVEKLWHPTTYLVFPLSGAAANVEALPERVQDFILLLPMVHGVELLREGYYGSAFHARYDVAYMAMVTGLISLFGLVKLREVSRSVVPE